MEKENETVHFLQTYDAIDQRDAIVHPSGFHDV
jgi:hypothetical protein